MHNCGFCTGLITGRRAMNAAVVAVGSLAMLLAAGQKPAAGQNEKAEPAEAVVEVSKPTAGDASLSEQVNAAFGLGASEIITLDLDRTPGMPLEFEVNLDGVNETVRLAPHSNRADGYQVLAQIADGSYVNVEPGPVRTLRGNVAGWPGSRAAGSMNEDGLTLQLWMPDGVRIGIEPIASRVKGAAANQYVLYRTSDIVSTGGHCGADDIDQPIKHEDPPVDQGGIAGATIYCTQIACDADFDYYQDHGSNVANVETAINNVINAVNNQYEAEVDIRHVITTIIVRTAEPDPYTATNAGSLLCEFRSHWNANQTGVVRDIAHLFTGKNIDGGVIGIAWLGVICNVSANVCSGFANAAYSLVQSDASPNFACKSDLSAHELGHNWDATHCSCPTFTMNPSLTCVNTHAPNSIAEIVAHRNSRTCLEACEDGTTTLPFFDDVPTAPINGALWTGIDGAEANTLALNEPSGTFSINLDGDQTLGGNQVRSALINTDNLAFLQLSYYYQRTGGGDSPETGEDLVVEYVADTGGWVELHRQLGSGADMTTFSQVTATFPANAFHPDFRLRFRSISTNINSDDWFIDNINLIGFTNPTNNNCNQATIAIAGSHAFSTFGATTDGPNEPNNCNFNGNTQISNDIWYLYPAQCTGTATVSLCGATFDSKIAIYGATCPGGTSNLTIACADNTCGDDPTVTFPVIDGQIYRIRVGGVNNAVGSGNMVITCTPASSPCPADIAPAGGNDVVDVDDLLTIINAWGPCINPNNCPADIAPAGGNDVVDVDDLLTVINAWGNCPP